MIIVDGIKFKTSEHLYHYKKMKFLQQIGDPITDEFIQRIIDAPTPKETKRLGHTFMPSIVHWDEVKVEHMMDVLREKFKYQRFKDILLETGNDIIVEDSYFDTFWGCGNYRNPGLNMLGKCLMNLRDELREEN
jgi:ribA/ribD-fused uncharacterized protein